MFKLILGMYVITTAVGLIVLKLGTKNGLPISIQSGSLTFNLNLNAILGIMLYGVSFVLYIYLISKNDLGYIIPIAAAFVYILIFVGSYIVFNESFTPLKIAGISLIILGLILINVKS